MKYLVQYTLVQGVIETKHFEEYDSYKEAGSAPIDPPGIVFDKVIWSRESEGAN